MSTNIPLTQKQYNQIAEHMAQLACAAYYRAKLEPLYFGATESLELEQRLKRIVDANWQDWMDSAKALLNMAYVIIKKHEQ